MVTFALARAPTPILNRPDFSYVFGGCPQNILLENNLLKPLEMIALPGTLFTTMQKHPLFPHIYEVKVPSYPSQTPLYVDGRFLEFYTTKPTPPLRQLPPINTILHKMESLIDYPYIWGGNYSHGIENMLTLYPPKGPLTSLQTSNWTFKGVDCSGMLYEATLGLTPRNTSQLATYGEGILIEGLTNEAIKKLLKPLDMIIWHGHVLFILDGNYTIESRAHRGCVFITKITERLNQINTQEKKIPMNSPQALDYKEKGFVVRRWSVCNK